MSNKNFFVNSIFFTPAVFDTLLNKKKTINALYSRELGMKITELKKVEAITERAISIETLLKRYQWKVPWGFR